MAAEWMTHPLTLCSPPPITLQICLSSCLIWTQHFLLLLAPRTLCCLIFQVLGNGCQRGECTWLAPNLTLTAEAETLVHHSAEAAL